MDCYWRRWSAEKVSLSCAQPFAAAESEIEGGISPRVAPFADVRELGSTPATRGVRALPVIDSERLAVRYDSAFALLRDLRRHGRHQCAA